MTKEQQLAQIREWMTSASGRIYKPNDKRRYAVLGYDGQSAVMTPQEAERWLLDFDNQDEYSLSERWMTPAQYERLPEFEGF